MSGAPSSKHRRVKVTRTEEVQVEVLPNYYFISPSQEPETAVKDILERFAQEGTITVTIAAGGGSCWKVVPVAEVVKRRIPGLHQQTVVAIDTADKTYAALEEGCDEVVVQTHSPVLRVMLCRTGEGLDKEAAGYQAPLPEAEVQSEEEDLNINLASNMGGGGRSGGGRNTRERGNRRERRGRGGRKQAAAAYDSAAVAMQAQMMAMQGGLYGRALPPGPPGYGMPVGGMPGYGPGPAAAASPQGMGAAQASAMAQQQQMMWLQYQQQAYMAQQQHMQALQARAQQGGAGGGQHPPPPRQ